MDSIPGGEKGVDGEYRTVLSAASAEFTERHSRFIGHAAPVSGEEEAAAFLRSVREKHREATHNVSAWRLRAGQLQRYSDDGEPRGTAGVPVLDVILKSDVTDTAVVVTRYFGGVLLGAGGLVRAYSRAASLALQQAGVAVMRRCFILELSCSYAQYAGVGALIPERGGVIDRSDFTDSVRIRFHLECGRLPGFEAALSDFTRGECRAEAVGEKYFAVL